MEVDFVCRNYLLLCDRFPIKTPAQSCLTVARARHLIIPYSCWFLKSLMNCDNAPDKHKNLNNRLLRDK